MQYETARLVFIVLSVCAYEVSAVRLTGSESKIASSIAGKLDGLLRRCSMDLQLVLDSSGSIGSSSFVKGKNAKKMIVTIMNSVCPIRRGSRVGLIEFSEPRKTHVEFKFGRHSSVGAVHRAIDRVGYDDGSSTATALALSMAWTQFLQNSSSNKKVIWITTDGNSNTGGNPIGIANLLKRMGITICTMAIGTNINMNEIRSISSPGCYYQLRSYSSYERVMKQAVKVSKRSRS